VLIDFNVASQGVRNAAAAVQGVNAIYRHFAHALGSGSTFAL
jgi:hypothetical protein